MTSNTGLLEYENVIKSRIGAYLFGRFCREEGAMCAPKWLMLEAYCKLVACSSLSATKSAAFNILDTFLDENAFAPPCTDSTDTCIFVDLGKPDTTNMSAVGGGLNPVNFDNAHELFEQAQSAVAMSKKKGKVDIAPFTVSTEPAPLLSRHLD